MSNSNILIVEDDKEISMMLKEVLNKEFYNVRQVFNGKDAIEEIEFARYDLILLDLMLPKIDGIEVLRIIRQKSNVPVLIISAKNNESDRILGLGIGADDYITKPFSIYELVARIKANIRRYKGFDESNSKNKVLKAGEIEMDINKYMVNKNGIPVILTPKQFNILKLLMENPKVVFTKAQIFESVWNNDYISDENTVMVHIKRIRNKIEDDPTNPKYIVTVWGIGYKLGDIQ